MSEKLAAVSPSKKKEKGKKEEIRKILERRESKELVVALAGPVGSAVPETIKIMTAQLKNAGYTNVVPIKISKIISSLIKKQELSIWRDTSKEQEYNRYSLLQDWGNKLRNEHEHDILAEAAIMKIAVFRTNSNKSSGKDSVKDVVPQRTAYVIDQLKHPAEVELLRKVYGDIFFLVGCLSSYYERKEKLKTNGVNATEADRLMERDKNEHEKHGQQLEKTLKLSDYFVRGIYNREIENQVLRFIKLVHGVGGLTPTIDEYGMYSAFSAGLKSACLSRQVGAAILDDDGNIIVTGRNDAPKAGGGLYTSHDGDDDGRCYNLDRCASDKYKIDLHNQIGNIVNSELDTIRSVLHESISVPVELNVFEDAKKNISRNIYENTRLSALIEFSRSVHAEMDAIVSASRLGGVPLKGSTLFTTTFPCHNCARHIVAAGISKVIYIEPYEKSLARELHGDAINFDFPIARNDSESTKVDFVHFHGVAPRQYMNLFSYHKERKDSDGKAIPVIPRDASKVVPQLLDGYIDMESKVVRHLHDTMSVTEDDLSG